MSRSRRKTPTIEATRRVFDGFLKIDEVSISHDRVSGPGRIERQRRLVLERGDSAAVLLHDVDADTILLTEQVRAPTIAKGPGVIRELPAGSIEAGETAAACMLRELREEIGVSIPRRALKRIATFYVSPGGTSERIVLFYARIEAGRRIDPTASGVAAEGEDVAMVTVPRAEFVRRALAGRIDDAKTLVAGLWLASQRS